MSNDESIANFLLTTDIQGAKETGKNDAFWTDPYRLQRSGYSPPGGSTL
jgi:hypothetical protein